MLDDEDLGTIPGSGHIAGVPPFLGLSRARLAPAAGGVGRGDATAAASGTDAQAADTLTYPGQIGRGSRIGLNHKASGLSRAIEIYPEAVVRPAR